MSKSLLYVGTSLCDVGVVDEQHVILAGWWILLFQHRKAMSLRFGCLFVITAAGGSPRRGFPRMGLFSYTFHPYGQIHDDIL